MSVAGFDDGLAIEPQAAPGFFAAQSVSVRWEAGVIADVAPAARHDAGAIDAGGMLVLPGFVCGHVEVGAAFLAGMPALKSEGDSARARRMADAHDEASLFAAARLAALDAAKAGVTVLFDLWRGKFVDGALDVIARAFEEVGIRGVLAADVDESCGEAAARAAIRENARFAGAARPAFRAMMGISNPAALSVTLPEAVREARKHEMAMHLVLGGGPEARRRLAERGVMRPDSLGVVVEPLDDEERALMRDLHVWPVLTPRADAARGVAAPQTLTIFTTRALLGGWDASADPLAEKSAAFASRRVTESALAFDEAAAFSLLARGYDLAAATFDEPFGRFAIGSPADFAFLDAPLPAAVNAPGVPSQLARLGSRHVRHVVCAGETIVRDGRATRVDEAEVRASAREQAKRLWSRPV